MKAIKTSYLFPSLLLSSIIIGGLTGYFQGNAAAQLKPLGDIFLNLIFTAIVPLIFFSVASSVARISKSKQLGKIIFSMFMVFIFTGLIAASFMLIIVKTFPPAQNVVIQFATPEKTTAINMADQIVNIFTVSDFSKLLSHTSLLALIFFSILVGLATGMAKEKGQVFARFLQSGADVFMQLITLIMYLAPIGFFAYFAVMVGEFGPQLLQNYFRVTLIYYFSAAIYFVFAFTLYAYLAGKKNGVITFWQNISLSMLTSLATCSSAASIPANLQATKKMNVSPNIYETVIPLGAILHKDGSVLGAIVKIAFLFGVFHLSFSGLPVLLMAVFVAILVGTVMGAIPSGGMLGEMLILSLYGFPPQALIIIAAISIIIDPLATMLNVTGDAVASLLVEKMVMNDADSAAYHPEESPSVT